MKNLVRLTEMVKVRNEEVRRSTGIEKELASRVNQLVLKWFSHMERINKRVEGC